IKDYVAKDLTTMVRNPAYARKAPWSEHAGPPPLEAVVWKFIPEAGTRVTTLESGETQGVYAVPAHSLPRLEKNPASRVQKAQAAGDGVRTRAGQRLEIVLNAIEYGGGPDPPAQLIQTSLHEAGIDVKIKAQARPPWYEDNYRCATRRPVMFLRATDPDGVFALFHSSLVGANFNWSCVKSAKLDGLLEQGRRESDAAKRRALYLSIAQLALDEALTVPLVDELSVWAFRTGVQSVKYNFNAYPILGDATLRR